MSDEKSGKKDGWQKAPHGGVDGAAEMIRLLDPDHQKRLLAEVASRDPKLAEKIRSRLLKFEDLVKLSDLEMQLLLKAVPEGIWILALRAAPDEVRDKVFQSLTLRAREHFQEEIAAQGPKKVTDVRDAQKTVARFLEDLILKGMIEHPYQSPTPTDEKT